MQGRGLSIAAVAIGIVAIILGGYAIAVLPSQIAQTRSDLQTQIDTKTAYQPVTRSFTILIGDKEVVGEDATGTEVVIGEYHLFKPEIITVNKGDTLSLTVINTDSHSHSFVLTDFAIDTNRIPGSLEQSNVASRTKVTTPFVADEVGVFRFACGIPFDEATMDCAPDHGDMGGYLIVLQP